MLYICQFLYPLKIPVPDEVVGGPPLHCATPDLRVVDQVLGPGEGEVHPLDGEEGGQVGRVAGDHQQGEHPPETGQCPGAGGPQHVVTSVAQERGECLPQ